MARSIPEALSSVVKDCLIILDLVRRLDGRLRAIEALVQQQQVRLATLEAVHRMEKRIAELEAITRRIEKGG